MSTINPISSNIVELLTSQAASVADNSASTSSGSFADIFSEALNTANVTDQVDKASTLELLAGQSDSLAGLMIDAQKAEISLNLALQLRSKVLDAYKEIMSMQV